MHHFNMDPPRLLPADTAWISFLNEFVDQPGLRAGGYAPQPVYGTSADENDLEHLVVQQVRRAPEPHFFLTIGANHELTEQTMVEFAPLIRDSQAFDRQLWSEMQRIREFLRAHPLFFRDFQGLVDVQGHFYTMDLDMDQEWKDEGVPPNIDMILEEANAFLEHVRTELWNLSSQRQRWAEYPY